MHINAAKELTLFICSPLSQGTSLIYPHALFTRKIEIIYQWLSSSESNANQGKTVKNKDHS